MRMQQYSPTFVFPKKLTKQNNHVQSVEQFLSTALQMCRSIDFERQYAPHPANDAYVAKLLSAGRRPLPRRKDKFLVILQS